VLRIPYFVLWDGGIVSRVILKPGREKPVRQRHPWIFSGAISRIEGEAIDGEVCDVASSQGEFLARGYLNRRSQIAVRLLSWNADEAIDAAFWRARIQHAIDARPRDVNAQRWVNAESDGLPGLIVDRYGEWLVVQVLTLGMEKLKDDWLATLIDAAHERMTLRSIYERSDVDVRDKEGQSQTTGVLHGAEPPPLIEIDERDATGAALRFLVDVKRGHKTGFYLDQSENRRRASLYCRDAEVLNLFSYTGAFAVHALAASARRAVNVDSAADALALAKRNLELNGFAAHDEDFVDADAFELLRRYRSQGRSFDVIILDPPKFVHSTGQLNRAARAYKDLNRVAMLILREGGVLVTFSCSGLVSADLFQKIVFGAALDAARQAHIVERLAQAADHAVRLSFPEAAYLKGLVLRVWKEN
jgi:23S rRNA (cytosine1962-C5)-methyltransferase